MDNYFEGQLFSMDIYLEGQLFWKQFRILDDIYDFALVWNMNIFMSLRKIIFLFFPSLDLIAFSIC